MECWESCCLPSAQGRPRGQCSPTVLNRRPRPPAEPHTTISGQSPGLGSHHKKECSWAIRGFWIKSNTFEVLTQIPGPREQPVLMPGAAGGSRLTERSLRLLEQHCSLHKCLFPPHSSYCNFWNHLSLLPFLSVFETGFNQPWSNHTPYDCRPRNMHCIKPSC